MDRPVFFYDFYSPYSYLAAERINELLPVSPEWRPVSFGHMLAAQGRVPWSLDERREAGIAECERRASERGLLPMRWPEGWPRETYSLLPLRAAWFAKGIGRVEAFSLACLRQVFAGGKRMDKLDNVLIAAAACELHPRAVKTGMESRSVKEALQEATEEAISLGVEGVPTVKAGDELFWGDDRLEDAGRALA